MSIGIKTLDLVNESSGITLQEDIPINGKLHKLLTVKLGFEAHVKVEVFFRSIRAKTEIRNKAKWIWAIQDENTQKWTLNNWADPKVISIDINGKKTTKYADSPQVVMTSHSEHSLGKLYWLEAFIINPEMPDAAIPKGIYVTFKDSPMLKKACFTDKGFCDFKKEELKYVPVTQYGKNINLFLSTYNLPNPALRHHNFGVFKITIFSKKTGKAVGEEFAFEQQTEGVDSFLGVTKVSLLVDQNWRKEVDHKEKTMEEFYAEVSPVFYENKNATLASKGIPKRPYTILDNREGFAKTTAPNNDAVLISHYRPRRLTFFSAVNASVMNSDKTDYEETVLDEDSSVNTFKVLYNIGAEIQARRSNKVGKQMASILDTNHECIPNNFACKYTQITIGEKGKDTFEVLKETDQGEVQDNSQRIFGIIAGDTKTVQVDIKLKDLTHAGSANPVQCLEIGGRHQSPEDVFDMSEVITETQGLHDKDYTIKEDELNLFLKYNYNKTYESTAQKWLGIAANSASAVANLKTSNFDIAWIARYFIMRKEHAQAYFVPVKTCRYPNQVVRLDVYPDFEWWINFKYNAKNAVYVYQKPNYNYKIFTSKKDQNQGKNDTYQKQKSSTKKWEYEFEFEAGFKFNGIKESFNTGDGFPLINAIKFILQAYGLFRKYTFADETEAKERTISLGQERSSKGEVARSMSTRYERRKSKGFPFKIDVARPSLSGGVHGKYAYSKSQPGSVGQYYNLNLAASPLFGITGKLDLLFFAQFIGPIGQALHRINQVVKKVNFLTLGAVNIDYYLYVAAEVKFNVDIDAMEYHSIDGWGGGDLQSRIDIKLWIEAGVIVNVSIQGVGGAEGKGVVRGEAKMHINIIHEKRTNSSEGTFKFDGLDAKIWVKFSTSSEKKGGSKKDTKPGESPVPEEKPTGVKRIIEAGEPWKIDIL